MAASNVVQQLVNILQELQGLETNITPPVTQFKDKPIFRLTHEEYINQELSIFRKIVTPGIRTLEVNEINTQRYLMSSGLDYQTASIIREKIINNSVHLSEVLEEFEDSDNTIFGRINLQCMITTLCCQKKQIDIKITKKIKELEENDTNQSIIELFEKYKNINYNPDVMDNANIKNYVLKELPNDGCRDGNSNYSFFKAIEDYKTVMNIKSNNLSYVDSNILDDDIISTNIISKEIGDIQKLIDMLIPDKNYVLHVYHRDYDIYNKLNKPFNITGVNPSNLIHIHIHIVCDGTHYQLITKIEDIFDYRKPYQLKKGGGDEIKGLSIQYPLYYNEKYILTKREDLSTLRKLKILYEKIIYSRYRKFKELKLEEQLHVLHRFDIDIDIPIDIDQDTNESYKLRLDEYIQGIINK